MVCFEPSDVAKAQLQPTSADHPDSCTVPIPPNPSAANNGKMHPVIRTMQEIELGKFVLASAIAIVGIVVAAKDRLAPSEIGFILVLVCLGFTAILYGILLRDTFGKFAQIAEPLGIALVVVSFFAIVAFFMPVYFLWVPALCVALLCLLPFVERVCHSATGA